MKSNLWLFFILRKLFSNKYMIICWNFFQYFRRVALLSFDFSASNKNSVVNLTIFPLNIKIFYCLSWLNICLDIIDLYFIIRNYTKRPHISFTTSLSYDNSQTCSTISHSEYLNYFLPWSCSDFVYFSFFLNFLFIISFVTMICRFFHVFCAWLFFVCLFFWALWIWFLVFYNFGKSLAIISSDIFWSYRFPFF